MRNLLIVTVLLVGCVGADESAAPDASVTVTVDADPQLPSCVEFGCGVGALTPECPWSAVDAPCACTDGDGATHYCLADEHPPVEPDPHTCAALGCGASFGNMDCSRIDEPGAPCYCVEGVTGDSGWCFPW